MDAPSAVLAARALLADVTPLKTDCGRFCSGACCVSLPGEETGMLLFPGEEELYAGLPGYHQKESALGPLLVCSGTCRREERPLACRLFPLLPLLGPEGVTVRMDQRARPVCPLFREGLNALDPAFTEAVRACGLLLAAGPVQRAFLEKLTAAQAELRALRRRFL